MSFTIFLADDHPVVRDGLKALLSQERDFQIVGEAADGLEAVRQVERLNPNVLVLDLMMPGLNGTEVARRVQKDSPRTRVIILSMHADESYVVEALQAGALGYVLKEASARELVQAVRQVAVNRRYLSSAIPEQNIDAYLKKFKSSPPDPYQTLSTREREVLQLVVEGHTSAEIGKRLFISSRTVEDHRANLMRKLGVHNQADLIHYAFQRGLKPVFDSGKASGRRSK